MNAIFNPFSTMQMIAARWLVMPLTLLTCGAMGAPAAAAFTHISLEHHATVQTPQGPRQVLRLYANFSLPNDQLLAWGGDQQNPAVFKTMMCNSQTGGNFYNPRREHRAHAGSHQ